MLRVYLFSVMLVLVLVNFAEVNSKYCPELDIRNNISSFEVLRGCKVIVGNLRIVLFELSQKNDFENLSFPELVEVKGHVLFYRVYRLTTLSKLFPNLVMIRGLTPLRDYSLMLFDMPDLQEIGLKSLMYIPRGKVYIQRCPNLCYVDTVNWNEIGSGVPDIPPKSSNQTACTDKCSSKCTSGYCWNYDTCQTTRSTSCPADCKICTEESKKKPVNQCLVCNYLSDNGTCVKECPPNKFSHAELAACVTEAECKSVISGRWWTFGHECINSCPKGYMNVTEEEGWCRACDGRCIKWCSSNRHDGVFMVDTLSQVPQLKACTHINGSLSIKISSKDVVEELYKNLESIEEITGFLKISRSYPITSLEFLQNLRVIHGRVLENHRHALIVHENQSLHKLWDWGNFSLTIKKGTISFHYNPQLCLSEIKRLAHLTNHTYTNIDVSPYSNGDKTACSYVELNTTFLKIGSNSVEMTWNNLPSKQNETLVVGYLLYYLETEEKNVTAFYGQDECDEKGWNANFVSDNITTIANLKPFTQYAYYIKPYVSFLSEDQSYASDGGQTRISYFRTATDDPSPPRKISAVSTSSTVIKLSWLPPEEPNGNVSSMYYYVTGFLEKDDPKFIAQRDYCRNPPDERGSQLENARYTSPPTLPSNNSECTCSVPTKDKKDFDVSCGDIHPVDLDDNSTFIEKGCKNFMYFHVNKEQYKHPLSASEKIEGYSKDDQNIIQTVPSNRTSVDIRDLHRFSMYLFLVSACNIDEEGKPRCSSPILVYERTKKNETFDNIHRNLTIIVEGNDVIVKWYEPQKPNSMVLTYEIEHKRHDIENAKTIPKCITRDEHRRNKYVYKMKNLLPGKYVVRVKATSLAGPGRFTQFYKFEIDDESKSSFWIVILIFMFIMLAIVLLFFYVWYRRKHKLDSLHLIADINPDYAGTVYIEDEWEMDRNDIEIISPLGKGTFGMVYNGLIKSRNLHCAIKTMNEDSKVHDRMEFLNEAAIMKSFSDAQHVVKLLGVVSRGDVPLVIMELMQRGDLKSYLRRSRDSSNSITCAEMYRMAAEIADGMAYLAAKKFVHRDLAARNCMVSGDRTVKVGDFGMTRDIYENDYYRKESRGLLPVRWMAPESLADGIFTSDSDVWSYGVVLWEMATLAEQPYQGLANEQVLQYVIAKGTLDRPPECPDLLYEIMAACWKWRPINRPQFINIVEKLESHVGQDFRLVSFYHSREGEEHRLNCKDRVYNPPALSIQLDRNNIVRWTASDDDASISSDHPNELLPYPRQREAHNPSSNNFH